MESRISIEPCDDVKFPDRYVALSSVMFQPDLDSSRSICEVISHSASEKENEKGEKERERVEMKVLVYEGKMR